MTYKYLDTRKIPLLALAQARTRLMKQQKQEQIRDGTKPGFARPDRGWCSVCAETC